MTLLINSKDNSKIKDSTSMNNNYDNKGNSSHSNTKSHKKYKIVLLGESGAGKSSLAQRLIKNE